jgi:mono/diheme cytochrome c family protein
LAVLCLTGLGAARAADPPDSRDFFEKRIRPVFARNCNACHGTTRMGGLDMTSRESLLQGGASGPSIVPGKSDQSLLVQAVSHQHEKIRMPAGQPRLADEQIADISEWVKAGAFWPEPVTAPTAKTGKFTITPEQRSFWSLQPIAKPAGATSIDRLLLAKMQAKGVRPVGSADRRTLIRRIYYDLTGLPPSKREIDEFVNNNAPDAWAKLVDRLLDSPRYGERWGRYWLDLARYSDDRLESEVDAPYANAFRYRDWVIKAFNKDMPFNMFVKAQIAGDQLGEEYAAGLGFYGLRPDTQDDRVDATGRVFLGLTTGCAQCHNHKFDPIPTTDYYALQGVFESTENTEIPLAPESVVKEYKAREKAYNDKKAQIQSFLHAQAQQLAEMLAQQTARYVTAVRTNQKPANLDAETLERWRKYLARGEWEHPFLKDWSSPKFDAAKFQEDVLAVWKERKTVDEENVIRRAEAKKTKKAFEPVSLKTESFYLWRDLFFNDFYGNQFKQEDDGLLYYGPNRGFYESDGTVERFLLGGWRQHLEQLREEAKELKAQVPAQYPFLHAIKDASKLKTERVRVGGNAENLGEEVPRRFLTALCDGEPAPFQKGSGRLELAEAIASPKNPLTARVIANRIWHHHFGVGIVRTPSDFGFMGDRPSHPELLDYLASRLIEQGWSMKALHREILLSTTYRLGTERLAANQEIDPENRLMWRANMRRLDAEAMRDSLLAVTGELDATAGGPPSPFADPKNVSRSVYGLVSRRKLDGTLALFDFPNANATSEKRSVTITPTQQLYFLNSDFLMDRAKHLAAKVQDVNQAYAAIFGRAPSAEEQRIGAEFVKQGRERWPLYVQALLTSNEFVFVN